MARYIWEGKGKDGVFQKGVVTADSESDAINELQRQGISIMKIKEKPPFSWSDLAKMEITIGSGVTPRDLMVFTRQFATMIDAGLPIVQALDILATTSENPRFGSILTDIREKVEQGATLSEAMSTHPKVFDRLFVNLVHAGEVGGVLDTVMNRLAIQIEKSNQLKRKVKSATSYPIIVVVVAVLVLGALLVKVIPTFEKMFRQMGNRQLPSLTRMVIDASRWTVAHLDMILLIGIVMGAAFYAFIRTDKGRYIFHKFLLGIPVIGDVLKKISVARFARTMGTLLSSGVNILEAMDIVAAAAGNVVIEKALKEVKEKLTQGQNIAGPLAETDVFPHMVVQMVGVGEQTGALDTMLNKIADFYEDEVDAAVESMTSMIEPLLMAVLGGAVGVVLIAMYLPIFQLAGNIGH